MMKWLEESCARAVPVSSRKKSMYRSIEKVFKDIRKMAAVPDAR